MFMSIEKKRIPFVYCDYNRGVFHIAPHGRYIMECPLVKDQAKQPTECKAARCAWWDGIAEQCSIVTIAIELRNMRYGNDGIR